MTTFKQPADKPVSIALRVSVVAVAGVVLTSALQWGVIAGDPLVYYDRMAEVFSEGKVPYLETAFEHLPAMLVPMSAVWFMGGMAGPAIYQGIWAGLCLLGLIAAGASIRRLGIELQTPRLEDRWLLVAAPLIPIVLFRTEVWVVLPAVLALIAVLQNRRAQAGVWTYVGVMAKAWPAVVASAGLMKRQFRWVVASGLASLVSLAWVVSTPGFQQGRGFTGLHLESVGGSVGGAVSILRNGSVELMSSGGAVYVAVDRLWWIAGLVPAVLVVGLMLSNLPRSDVGMPRMIGASIAALLLASPLQSTQFLFWLTPFVAFEGRRVRVLAVAMGTIGLAQLAWFDGSGLWWTAAVVRNAMLFVLAWTLTGAVSRPDTE